jgi:hypothetical protein
MNPFVRDLTKEEWGTCYDSPSGGGFTPWFKLGRGQQLDFIDRAEAAIELATRLPEGAVCWSERTTDGGGVEVTPISAPEPIEGSNWTRYVVYVPDDPHAAERERLKAEIAEKQARLRELENKP